MVKNIGYLILLISFIFISSDNYFLSGNNIKQVKPVAKNRIQNQKVSETGKDIYQKYCLSCHQKDGSGVPSTFPSLIKSNWVNGDKTKLIRILLNGLQGEITVDEDTYNGIMPKQDKLTDIQIASVLTFLRQNFENNASAVNPKEVTMLKKK